ncbi:MAG: DUF1501 domain-containing protein [Fibrobacteres bacterium]|jgi:uncharacterized protein (DUF1501 family)|nr:DUF1501 domain-containing protein [Fibrobacterota bacterium]
MDRRTFLKTGLAAMGAVHLAGKGFFNASAASLPGAAAARSNGASPGQRRILVVVRLDGGNDGLNTVVPLDRMDSLARARANILIPESKLLRLDATTALHPALSGLHKAYQEGDLRILQAVGYPSHNQSHFRSTDIWFSGSDSNQVLESGVLGRYLEGRFPGFPAGYPNAAQPHPPSIQIGSTLLMLLQGQVAGMGMAISDPSRVYAFQPDGIDVAPDTPWGHELTFIRQMASQTHQYGDAVKTAMAKATTKSSLYPATGNRLADQLKGVARLIAGGLDTPIYVVSMGGFDTHSGQVNGSDTATGAHADLLRQLSEAVSAFLDDLRLMGEDDRVVGFTVSEFGRRILSNASLGTDHGTAAPMFVFGKPVAGGIEGTSPEIPTLATARDNVPMQIDFRSVYSTLLAEWLQVRPAQLRSILQRDFPATGLLKQGYSLRPPGQVDFEMAPLLQDTSGDGATLSYTLYDSAQVQIGICDLKGRTVRTVFSDRMPEGRHAVRFSTTGLASGHFLLRMKVAGGIAQQGFDLVR